MSQARALLWKEWFEVRAFAGIALFVFLGLPLIGAIEGQIQRGRFELLCSVWVYMLGGVMAVVIGTGVVVRDVNGRLEAFWRSRPVNVVSWLLVKYLVGLATLLATLIVPVLVELNVNRRSALGPDEIRSMLLTSPFLWIAAFSLSFAVACFVRRGAHAAMLSISLLLMLYFLPSIIPPIHVLSPGNAADEVRLHGIPTVYWLGMIGISVVAVCLAVVALLRDWRVESGRKMMYWSIGGVLLLLFSSAAFQVATNLPLLQTGRRPAREYVHHVYCDGGQGVLLTTAWTTNEGPRDYVVRAFRITGSEISNVSRRSPLR